MVRWRDVSGVADVDEPVTAGAGGQRRPAWRADPDDADCRTALMPVADGWAAHGWQLGGDTNSAPSPGLAGTTRPRSSPCRQPISL
jgi:hypothetical protein